MEMVEHRLKYPKLKAYLEKARVRKFNQERVVSQEEWARQIGISGSRFSQYLQGASKPEGANLEAMLADPYIGINPKTGEDHRAEFYAALDMIPPDADWMLRDVLIYFGDLPAEEQKRIAEDIRQKAEANRKKRTAKGGLPGVD